MFEESDQDPIGELIHLYVDGAFPRRELIARVTKMLGSGAAATAALGGYSELLAQAQQACPAGIQVPLDAPDIVAGDVQFRGQDSTIYAHFAYPRNFTGRLPGVIVIHENRGLVDHIKDVCRRTARAGFMAVAPDLLSRQGGIQKFPDAQMQSAAYGRTTVGERRADLISALDFLKYNPSCQWDRIGTVGFCAGGGNALDLAVYLDELRAAAIFYGTPPPPIEDLQKIQAPLLMNYAERDRALTTRIAPVMTELLARQKVFGFTVYEGTNHAFHNDTGAAYDPVAACDAWAKTIAFFNKFLRVP